MNSGCKILFFALIIIACQSADAQDKKSDKWFSSDKIEHFAVSAFYSGGLATVANRHFEYDKEKSLAIGISFTISIGFAKEVVDMHKPEETSSAKDFIWDLAGALTGALIAGLAL